MDERVEAEAVAEPEIEGDVAVARGHGGVVVLALSAGARAAVGLQGDGEVAAVDEAEDEGSVDDGGVCGGVAPVGR